MATTPRSQIPLKFEFLGPDNKVTQPWAFFLQTLYSALPPAGGGGTGSGFVIDSTAGITGPTTLYQGPAGSRGSAPAVNAIYIADDTGQIFTVQGGQWQLQSSALTGDITKAAFSAVTALKDVNAAPGVYGSGSTVPVLTIDAKGRVTSAGLAPVELPYVPGLPGDVLYKSVSGQIGANGQLNFDPDTGILNVAKQITFVNPAPTFKNLSPAKVKGDLITSDGVTPIVLPVGSDGYVLTADSSAANGIKWTAGGGSASSFIEVPFSYGDASPKLLGIIASGKMVLNCSVRIINPFNGTSAALSVGSSGTPDDIMATGDNYPGIQSTWSNNPNTIYGSDTNVYLTINSGADATAGSGLLVLTIQL